VLRAQDGLSNARLARRSLVTPQSMSEVLAVLLEQGYVQRLAEPGHGRIIRIELTKAGFRALERCDRAVDEVEREMLGDLDPGEAADLRDALIRCGRTLERDGAERAGILKSANEKDGAA
jgi:DNA-binding MarR family transcriptional regulator